MLLYKQESYVLNSGFTTEYFNLEKSARQGDYRISILFILALEMFFFTYQKRFLDKVIKDFDYIFLYTSYAKIQRFSSKI